MAISRTYETFTGRPVAAFRLIDQFAAAIKTQGVYPPLIGKIKLLVTQRIDIGRVYKPPRELPTWANASGHILTGGDMLPAQAGDPSLGLAAGNYRLLIESDYYIAAEFAVQWPPAAAVEVNLLPAPAYPFPDSTVNPAGTGLSIMRGCLFAAGGTPMANKAVSLAVREAGWAIPAAWPFAQATTSEAGEWVLILPEQREMVDPPPSPLQGKIAVKYLIDGAAFDGQVSAGREQRFLQPSLRGSAAGANGRALAGVTVENSLTPGTSVTGVDGRWAIYFPFDQAGAPCSVEATEPNGQVLNRNTNVVAHKAVLVERFQFS